MPKSRVYQDSALQLNSEIILSPEASHHILRVLRLKEGDLITVFNGEAGEYQAKLLHVAKQQAHVLLEKYIDRSVESPLQIHLGQGISRGEKMDYTIQKAVELGVAKITPLFTERCGVKLTAERLSKRVQHWQAIAISACEQSGRNTIPQILAPQNFSVWLEQRAEQIRIMLDPCAKNSWEDLPKQIHTLAFAVGPEGGLTDAELVLAERKNFISLPLGPRILRTETAGLAAIAVMQSRWGDF